LPTLIVATAAAMGKVAVRLKEVVYMVSPFEVSIMNGLWKDFPQKVQKHLNERGWNIAAWCVAPTAAVMWYAEDYREKEKIEHRF